MSEYKKGIKVTCLDGSYKNDHSLPFRPHEITKPVISGVYTVRKLVSTPYGDGLLLKEITNKKFYFSDIGKYQEPIFATHRFEIVNENQSPSI